jgi:hypothetical protein
MMKDKVVAQMNIEFSEKEAQYTMRINELEKKMDFLSRENQFLLEKNDKLESEMSEMVLFYLNRKLKTTLE